MWGRGAIPTLGHIPHGEHCVYPALCVVLHPTVAPKLPKATRASQFYTTSTIVNPPYSPNSSCSSCFPITLLLSVTLIHSVSITSRAESSALLFVSLRSLSH